MDHNPDFHINEIENFINMINSNHKSVQLEGLVSLRKLISVDDNPPIEQVVDSGVVPKLLEIMVCEGESEFQVESSWCILNICSREEEKFTECIIGLGGLDIIVNLFDSQVEEAVLHAVWAMRNIAGSGSEYRDMCLQRDCVPKLLKILERFPTSPNLIDHTLHGLSNLTQLKPRPQWEKVLPALPVFHQHISEVQSPDALNRALWGLSSISEDNIQEVIDQGCVPYLVAHLCQGTREILPQTLRTLGNLLAGDEEQTDEVLIFPHFLPRVFELTQNDSNLIRKEAFWAISNIAAGSHNQIEQIIENNHYIERLKTAVVTENKEIAEEAAYGILNLFSGASPAQTREIVIKHELLGSLADIIKNFNSMKQNVLEAVFDILNIEGSCNPDINFPKHIKEAGLVKIIRDLANEDEFSRDANKILENLGADDQDEETENKGKSEENQDDSEEEEI